MYRSSIDMFSDDKLWVIWCVTFLASLSMWYLDSPEAVVNGAISGLFGVAVGRAMNGNSSPT